MECLLFLWWNFALYLACYDGTCYLDHTLHCNIYMDGTMCMDGTCLCMNNVYGWNWCDMWYETYVLDMCWICAGYETYICDMCCKLWDLIKKQKKQTICRLFAVCHRRQRALCRLPRTAKKPRGSQLCFLGADPFGQFAYSGRRQRVNEFAVSGGRQRPAM